MATFFGLIIGDFFGWIALKLLLYVAWWLCASAAAVQLATCAGLCDLESRAQIMGRLQQGLHAETSLLQEQSLREHAHSDEAASKVKNT